MGEINEAIDAMKDKKASIDEMPNEVWKYGGQEMRESVRIMCMERRKVSRFMKRKSSGADSEERKRGGDQRLDRSDVNAYII